MNKIIHLAGGLLAAGLSGCGSATGPLLEGEVIHCRLWDKPRPRQGETGSSSYTTFTSGKIRIYEHVTVVLQTNGVKYVAPHDWYSDVSFK